MPLDLFGKKKVQEEIDKLVAVMMTELAAIYKNKSSDEYKMCGDISKSPMYDTIERMIANLSLLKSFPKHEVDDLHSMFNVLHRPIFKKMVMEYIDEQTERNISFTALFTVGYRILVGELSRIFTCTEATDKGIVYKPDKISKREEARKLIKAYNTDLEGKIDKYIRTKMDTPIQESWAAIVGAGLNVLDFIRSHELIEWGQLFSGFMDAIFGNSRELNPLSFIDDVLSESYDNKIKRFDDICATYEATKEAYDEYMRIPEAQRQKKIESKYIRDLEKYNIQIKNLQAEIKHYDQRASEESNELASKIEIEKSEDTKPTTKKTTTPSDDDFDF